MKRLVYYAHPMEGLRIPEESQIRAYLARDLLGDEFEVWIPEEHQGAKDEQQDIDLNALIRADIILVDRYAMGLVRNGVEVLGLGTNQETGYVKGLNAVRKKQVPIVQVLRQTVCFHPFDSTQVDKNCHSLEKACKYIRENCNV